MNYKHINDIVEVSREDKILKSIAIDRSNVSHVTIISEYNIEWHCNTVQIKAKKDGKVIESRTFLDTYLFPRQIERTTTHIKIYLESFKHEAKDIQQEGKEGKN